MSGDAERPLPGSGRSRPLAIGSLCTGYGGLDLAVEEVLTGWLAWYSEVEPAPAAVMAHHHPGVPNHGDLTTFDWSTARAVDVLTAGYPCQPFSHAGKRKGTTDERHLWPRIADIIRLLRPGLVILENVAGHLSLGLDVVLADLASLGFDAEWSVVRASDVGACHQRARLFVLAYPHGEGLEGWGARPSGGGERPARTGRVAAGADADGRRLDGQSEPDVRAVGRTLEAPRRGDAERLDPDAADSDGPARRREQPWRGPGPLSGAEVDERPAVEPGRHGGGDDGGPVVWGEYAGAIARHAAVLGRPAPRPVDERGRLSPRFVEWMQMLPEGWVTDIEPNRTKALKMLGNGVVPPQAAHALRGLLARVSERAKVAA